jgi:hypothetical protein
MLLFEKLKGIQQMQIECGNDEPTIKDIKNKVFQALIL